MIGANFTVQLLLHLYLQNMSSRRLVSTLLPYHTFSLISEPLHFIVFGPSCVFHVCVHTYEETKKANSKVDPRKVVRPRPAFYNVWFFHTPTHSIHPRFFKELKFTVADKHQHGCNNQRGCKDNIETIIETVCFMFSRNVLQKFSNFKTL